jgi:hypothetical protein
MDGDWTGGDAQTKPEPLSRVEALSRFTGITPERYVPLELQAERSRRWTTRTLICAVLLLAVFNSRSISTWASTLPPNWLGVTVRDLAGVWGGRMAAAGLNRPRDATHSAYEGAKALTWRQLGGARVEVVTPKAGAAPAPAKR